GDRRRTGYCGHDRSRYRSRRIRRARLTRLLVEGGGRLAATLLRAQLVDRLIWFHAPLLLGGDGVPAVAALETAALAEMPHFERLATERIGEDAVTVFRARRPAEGDAPEPK